MGLMKCPGCGTTISDVLDACPGCGYRLRSNLFAPIKMDSEAIPVRCPWCGETVPAGQTHCPNCGSPAKVTHAMPKKQPEPKRYRRSNALSRSEPEPEPEERKRVSGLLIFLVILVLVAGIILGLRTLKWIESYEEEPAAMQTTGCVVTDFDIRQPLT